MEWKCLVALLLGFLPVLAIAAHLPGFNGPFYWKRGYTDVSAVSFALYLAITGGVIYWVNHRLASGNRLRSAILALTLVHFGLAVAFMGETERSLVLVQPERESERSALV